MWLYLLGRAVRRPWARIGVAIALFVMLGLYSLYLLPPRRQFPSHDTTLGLLNDTTDSSRFAIATFLTGGSERQDDPGKDHYFVAIRVLAYQLLHAPETRCNASISFVVLVTSTVSEAAKQQLRGDGVRVVEARDIPLRWWIRTGVSRWKDQFIKLRLLEMIEYDRVLFIDADTLIRGRIDAIFHELEVQTPVNVLISRQKKTDEATLPSQYTFAARSDNALTGARDHPFPPLQTEVFSAGFWIAAPSPALLAYLISVMSHYRRFDPHTMEQSLLNYAFRRNGPMPWREIHYRWSTTWPNMKDVEAGVITLHEKFWTTGPPELRNLWWQQKDAMEQYFANASVKTCKMIR